MREGKLARERVVEMNVGLVGRAVQCVKSASGGRVDLVQEVCINTIQYNTIGRAPLEPRSCGGSF